MDCLHFKVNGLVKITKKNKAPFVKLINQWFDIRGGLIPKPPVNSLNWPGACLINISTPLTMMAPTSAASCKSCVFLGA